MIITRSIVWAALVLLNWSASAAQPVPADLRGRVAAYEAQAAKGKANAEELVAIGKSILEQGLATSVPPGVVIQTCTSPFAPDSDTCVRRLWEVARLRSVPLAHRTGAAAALATRKDREAAPFLEELIKGVAPGLLVGSAEALLALSAEQSVPVLSRMLDSGEPATMTAACRVLGAIDASESRRSLGAFLASTPRGTQPWFACTIAAARLGDSEARQTSRFITNYLREFDLISAAEVLVEADQELAVSLLLQVTRQAQGVVRLEAADRLVRLRPDVAREVAESALESPQAPIRAGALRVLRSLKTEPDKNVRARLLDPDPLVRLRAAEIVIDADGRRRAR